MNCEKTQLWTRDPSKRNLRYQLFTKNRPLLTLPCVAPLAKEISRSSRSVFQNKLFCKVIFGVGWKHLSQSLKTLLFLKLENSKIIFDILLTGLFALLWFTISMAWPIQKLKKKINQWGNTRRENHLPTWWWPDHCILIGRNPINKYTVWAEEFRAGTIFLRSLISKFEWEEEEKIDVGAKRGWPDWHKLKMSKCFHYATVFHEWDFHSEEKIYAQAKKGAVSFL